VLAQAAGQRVGHRRVRIVEIDLRDAGAGERRRDGRPDATTTDDEAARAVERPSLALDAANEPGAVEHVAEKRSVAALDDRVARSGDTNGRRHLVEHRDRRYLMRHRDERAADVREPEQRAKQRGVVLRAHAHRHDDGIDARLLEVRVVDHRRLE